MKIRNKFMGGQMTPEEFHNSVAFPVGAACAICGAPPATQYTSFGEESELLKRIPALAILKTSDPERYQSIRLVIKEGAYLRTGISYSCKQCEKTADQAAAKHPTWAFVRIDRGPSPDKIVVGPGT